MYIIVGLGNPGRQYNYTRHNVGFDVVDYLGRKHDIKVTKVKHKSAIGEGIIAGEKVILVKPQTYMNLSGEAVMSLMNYYDIDLENLIVIYDDIDTAIGKLRIRIKGSGGSHNGMKNIIYHLQTVDFPRVRIGIGKPERQPLRDYVLQRFSRDEVDVIAPVIKDAGDAIELWIKEGVQTAMNKYNG